MKLRFEATETARILQNGHPLTELLVDDVTVVRRTAQCTGYTPGGELPPGPVDNTLVVEREGQDVVLRWARPAEDASHGPALFFPAYRSATPAGGFTQVAYPTALDWCDMGQAPAPAGNCFYLVAARNAAGDSGEAPTP